MRGPHPFVQPAQAGGVLVARHLGAVDRGRGFVQVRAGGYARDERPGPTEVATPGYTLIDLSGGVPLTEHLDLRAIVRNVLNETYYASPDTRFVFAPGINASITAVVKF